MRNSLDILDGAIHVSLSPDPSSRKPIIRILPMQTKFFLKYKAICFTGGSKLDGRVSRACVFYEDEAKKNYFPVSIKG